MENISLSCQVCLVKCQRLFEIKKHVYSKMHQTKMTELFQKEKFTNFAGFPSIIMMNTKTRNEMKQPILGLSLLTLCFSPETKTFFYMCHVCEEKCLPKYISTHLSSSDHCSNYFSYTDPNVQSFSWTPGLDMRTILRQEIIKETNKPERNQLQLLDLPADLLLKLVSCTYSEVMQSLSENDELVKLLKAAVNPKRTMIETYQTDSNRKHPLLGMQHIVECICVKPTERRHYLCTLCKLTVAPHVIIKHVLSFDHIYCYFKEWHPSTLVSKESYTDDTALAFMILDLAKQTLGTHAKTNTDIKQVRLEPDEFKSVNFTCYSDALDKLESITQKKKEGSLTTVPIPGKKLECCSRGALLPVKIYCQDCCYNFDHVNSYSKHLKSWHHKQTVNNLFGEESSSDGYEPIERIPFLKLFSHLRDQRRQTQPAVGVSLVVTFISSEVHVEPICVCFACSESFMDSSVTQHLNSEKHVTQTLLYLNPWRLPLAWKDVEEVSDLWSAAWKEEREREPHMVIMKILDLPHWRFQELFPPSYTIVSMTLKKYHPYLKIEVPKCQTFSKLKENERFPLLGRHFIAMHYLSDRLCQPIEVGFLCMLCRRRLSDQECYAHVFGREHITKFINDFHPGSMNSKTDVETIMDLAKQADNHHSTMNVQEIQLDRSIREPCSYNIAYHILVNAKLRKGQGKLLPNIVPKQKLVPRTTVTDKDGVRDNSISNSGKLLGSEEKSCQKSPDNKKTWVGAEIPDGKCAEREENAEEEVDMKSVTKSEQKQPVKTCAEEIKSPASETLQAIKEEKEELIVSKPSEEKTESCKYKDMDFKIEIGEQSNKSVQTHSVNNACKEVKTQQIGMCKEFQGAFCNDNMEKNMSCKKELPALQQGTSCEVEQRLPGSIQRRETVAEVKGREAKQSQQSVEHEASTQQQIDKLWQYLKRTSRDPVIGLSALFECHCVQCDPIYLCECCSMKIPEKDIVSHVTGVQHQRMFLLGFKSFPSPPGMHQGMKFCHYAALLEKHSGYGEAQVVDLEKEIYNNILKQSFKSAIQTVKELQVQQRSVSEPSSISALSNSQPVDTPFSPRAHNEASYVLDNYQVVAMDCDSEDSEARLSSVISSEREDAKVTHNKESASASNVYSGLTVSKSSEETSSRIYVSTNKTSSTCAHPDSTGKLSQAGLISNTNIRPIKEETTSNIVGTSQCAETSNYVVTNSIKSTTAFPTGTASCSSSGSIKKTAITPLSKPTANITSSSAATTSKSGSSVNKCAPSTFSSIPTDKSTIAKSHTSPTTTTSAAQTNMKAFNTCASCTTSVSAITTKSIRRHSSNSPTTATSTTQTNMKASNTCASSTTSVSAITTKSIRRHSSNSPTTATSTTQTNMKASNTCASSTTSVSAITTKSIRRHSSNSPTTTTSAAPEYSCTTTTANIGESVNKCAPSTFSSIPTDKSIIAKSHTSPTTTTSAAQTNMKASNTCASSTTSVSATTTRRHSSNSPTTATPAAPGYSCTTTAANIGESVNKCAPSTSSSNAKTGFNFNTILTTDPTAALSKSGTKTVRRECTTSMSRTNAVAAAYLNTTDKSGNPEVCDKTALVKKSAGSNADKATKNPNMTGPKSTVRIGVEQMIEVLSGNRRQLYCQLCASRLSRSGHPSSHKHKLNYVKMKLPYWSAEPSELKSKLANTVARFVELEQYAGAPRIQTLEVTTDVYDELKKLDEDKALARVTEMKRERDSGVSSSTADPVQVWTQDAHLSSPLDSSPDDEIDSWQNETAGLSSEVQSVQENKPELQTSLVKIAAVKKTPGNSTLTCKSESASPFAEASSSPETRENRNHEEKSDTELPVAQKVLEDSEKTSPVKDSNPNKLSSALSGNTEQHDQPTPRHKAEQSQRGSRPDHYSVLNPLPKTSGVASPDWSNLSKYLAVKNLDSEQIIGRHSVWECRGMSQTTFFLCESCSERLFLSDICQHMVSMEHGLNHLLNRHPQLMTFWSLEDVEYDSKLFILKAIVKRVSDWETSSKIDARWKLLPPKEFSYVKTAPFSEALKFLQDSEKEQNPSVIFPPISAPQQMDQLPQTQMDQVESEPTERKPAQVSQTDKRRDNEIMQETENKHVDGVKKRRVETNVSSRADTAVVPFSESGTCQIPQENSKFKQEIKPLVDGQHQRAITEFQTKPTEAKSVSLSSSVINAKTSPALPMSSGHECSLTRKRPADTSLETLARSCNSQLDERKNSSPQPKTKSASESTPVHPAASHTPVSFEDKKSGPGPKELKSSVLDITLDDLIALVNETRSEKTLSPCVVKSETLSPCSYNPSVGVSIKQELEFEHVTSAMPEKKKRLDSKVELNKSADDATLPPSTSDCTVEPQSQESVDAQSMLKNRNPSEPVPNDEATNHNRDPRTNPEPDCRESSQLPISPIITPRLDPSKPQLTGHYFAKGDTKVNCEVVHSIPTVATASHSESRAASAGYALTSQMPYTTNGYSFLPSSGAVGDFTTPAYPLAYNQSSYQGSSYGTTGLYQSHFKTNNVYVPAFQPCSETPTPLGWTSLQMQQQQQPHVMQQQLHQMIPQQQQQQFIQQQQPPHVMQQQLIQQQQQQHLMQQHQLMQQQLMQQQYSWTRPPPPIHYPPPANSHILTQDSANSPSWFFPVAPTVGGDVPPVAQGTFSSTK